MEILQTVNQPEPVSRGTERGLCPRCGERTGTLPPVEAYTLDRIILHRCARCGTRFTGSEEKAGYLHTCGLCSIPYLSREYQEPSRQTCPGCISGRMPAEMPGNTLLDAMELEVRNGLAERWTFIASETISAYLGPLARRVTDKLEGFPETGGRIVLVDHHSLRTLALPSGLILISLGVLDFLEDEAELAFVMAHEFSHALSGDVTGRLVRLGYHAATHEGEDEIDNAWAETVMDLVRLGYGKQRELEADGRAIDAVVALDYDPKSIYRFMERLEDRIRHGVPEVAEIAAAHPTPADRARHLDRILFHRADRCGGLKVNREVFRRAVGKKVLSDEFSRILLDDDHLEDREGPEDIAEPSMARILWIGTSIAVLTAIILIIGLLLSG